MDDLLHLPMFWYKGNKKWQNISKEWNETELATLFFCLETTLDNCENEDVRRDIIYLFEKLYNISDIIDFEDLIENNNK
jgi:hypothetical protein